MKGECWDKMMTPVRKVLNQVSKRMGLHKSGHIKLRQDIRSCEYEDVHVLWDMLKANDPDLSRTGKGSFGDLVPWRKHTAAMIACGGGR